MTKSTGGPPMVVSALTEREMPGDGKPELAFLGRSNSGKSSIINAVVGHRIAHTGGTPGKTLRINFFRMPGWYLVDLPGFGYAKVSKKRRAEFGQAVDDYLTTRQPLLGGVLVQDCRRDPEEEEQMIQAWAEARNVFLVVVANKADKLNRREQAERLERLTAAYRIPVFLASARTGEGIAPVKAAIAGLGLSV